MEDDDQQNMNTQPQSVGRNLTHQKIIRPSAAFIEELKNQQSAPTQPPQVSQNVPQTTTTAKPEPVLVAKGLVSSIYPEATEGIGAPVYASIPLASNVLNHVELNQNTDSKSIPVRVSALRTLVLKFLHAETK